MPVLPRSERVRVHHERNDQGLQKRRGESLCKCIIRSLKSLYSVVTYTCGSRSLYNYEFHLHSVNQPTIKFRSGHIASAKSYYENNWKTKEKKINFTFAGPKHMLSAGIKLTVSINFDLVLCLAFLLIHSLCFRYKM